MRKIVFVWIILAAVGCKPSPNYNPFDEQFDVSVREIVRSGCDTLSAGCGYFNLQVQTGKLRPFYQVFSEDFNDVVAKGFNYYVDTVDTKGLHDVHDLGLLDSLLQKPLDIDRFEEELFRFNYRLLEESGSEIKIINPNKEDTISLTLDIILLEGESKIIRRIEYWKAKESKRKLTQAKSKRRS